MTTSRLAANPLSVVEHDVGARSSRLRIHAASLARNKVALVSLLALMIVVCAALGAPWIAPHNPDQQHLALRLHPPAWVHGGSWSYPLGNDALGRDILSRIIYGSRISILVGVSAVVLQGLIGIALGLVAGYHGGWLDSVIMRLTDLQYAIPFLVLALAVMAALGPSLKNVILVLGITGWVYYARVVRSEVLSIRRQEFVEATRSVGASNTRLMVKHVLPNVMSSIIVLASLQVARMIISEASLSFLGMGVPPSIPSWGDMVAEGRTYVTTAWWLSALPGLAIFITVMAVNLFGDWMRDELDPTTKTYGDEPAG